MMSYTRLIVPSVSKNRHAHRVFRERVVQKAFITVPSVAHRRIGEVGPGGRASDAGITVAVFGASGFLGRYVCSDLGTNGVRTYIGNRGDEFEMRYLKPMFDLGRLRFCFYSPKDVDSMREVIADADLVINLIGSAVESRVPADKPTFPYITLKTNFTLEDANVFIPRTIAEVCKEMQVDNLIHFSCLSASPTSASDYARSKYEGDLAVKETFPWATIVKPAQVFGYEDRLLNYFALIAKILPVVPFADGGNSLTQPVFCADVARVVSRIVDNPEFFEGKTVHLFGPADYTYKELAQFVYDITGQDVSQLDLPKSWVKALAKILAFQRKPLLTPDQVELWCEDCVAPLTEKEYDESNDILTFKSFGMTPTPIEKVAFKYLHRFRIGGHFLLGEGYHGSVHVPSPKLNGRSGPL